MSATMQDSFKTGLKYGLTGAAVFAATGFLGLGVRGIYRKVQAKRANRAAAAATTPTKTPIEQPLEAAAA